MTEEQIFLAVLELADPTDRAAYLDQACGGDATFRRQVEDLLAAHLKSGEFLDAPLREQMAAGLAASPGDNTLSLRGHLMADEKKSGGEPADIRILPPTTLHPTLGRNGH